MIYMLYNPKANNGRGEEDTRNWAKCLNEETTYVNVLETPNMKEFLTSLKEELERIFKKGNLDEISQEEMRTNIPFLRRIYDSAQELNRKNALIKAKYDNDEKYARIHKRIKESKLTEKESEIQEVLMEVKKQTDESVKNNKVVLQNENFFTKLVQGYVITGFRKIFKLDAPTAKKINKYVVDEYLKEYNGEVA